MDASTGPRRGRCACSSGRRPPSDPRAAGDDPLRPRLLDGLPADLRLQVPGAPTRRPWTTSPVGYDTWCVDMEATGGRTSTATSTRHRDGRRRSRGRDGLHRPDARRQRVPDVRHLVGRAARGAVRPAPSGPRPAPRARRLRLDGRGSPTLVERRKRLPEFRAKNRRPIDRAFVRSIFTRDHPGTADDDVIEAFADAILALDDSVPTGRTSTCAPTCPWSIPPASPCPRSSCGASTTASPGWTTSWSSSGGCRTPTSSSRSCRDRPRELPPEELPIAYHILHAFFSQPAPIYRGA